MKQFDVDEFLKQYPSASSDGLPTEAEIMSPAQNSGFDVDSFIGSLTPPKPTDSFGSGLGTKVLSNIGAANVGLIGNLEKYSSEAPQRLGGYAPTVENTSDDQRALYNEYIAQKTGQKPRSLSDIISASRVPGEANLATQQSNAGKGVGDLIDVATSAPLAAAGYVASGGSPLEQAAALQKYSEDIKTRNQYNVTPGGANYYAAHTLEGLGTIAPALAASLYTKNPKYVASMLGAQSLGEEYQTQRAAGKTPSEAQAPAVVEGALNYAVGAMPLGSAIESTSGIVKTIGKSAAEQVVINNLLSDAQIGIEQGTLQPDQTFGDYLKKVADTTKDTTVLGVINGLLFGAGGHIAGKIGGKVAESAPKTSEEGGISSTEVENLPTLRDVVEGKPITPEHLSPVTDIDTAATTLSAIQSGDAANIHPDVASDLVKTGELQVGDDGQFRITDTGKALVDEIQQLQTPQTLAESVVHRWNTNDPTVNSDMVRTLLQNGEIQFKNGKIEVTPQEIKTTSPSDVDAQSVVNAIRSGQNVDSAMLRNLLRSGEVRYNEGKLEIAPPSNPSANAKNSDMLRNLLRTGEIKFNEAGKIEATPQGEPQANNITAETLRAIKSGDFGNAHSDTVRELLRSGDVRFNENGKLGLTDSGHKLYDSIENPLPKEVPTNPFNLTKEIPFSRAALERTSTPIADLLHVNPQTGERVLPSEDRARINQDKLQKAIINEKPILQELPASEVPIAENRTGSMEIPPKESSKLIEGSAFGKNAESDTELPYSITPKDQSLSNKFIDQKDNLKQKLTDIIRKINPEVGTEFSDKLFGEGEALKASGAESTSSQEVAGAYDKLKNLVHVSLNADKWNPTDTAFHEGYHAVREMINPADDAVLKEAFPKTEKLSQEEHEAVQFGHIMTDKNAPGFKPAVRRIFMGIRQALRDFGRTLKLGKFNSVEDIFSRVESGDIYKSYQDALRNGDIEALKNIPLPLGEQQKVIKEVSPALHDIVYRKKKLSPSDSQNLLDIAADHTEEGALKAVTHLVNTDGDINSKQVQDSTEKYLQYSMTPKEAEEYTKSKTETVSKLVNGMKEVQPIASMRYYGSVAFSGNDTNLRDFARHAIDPVTGERKTSKALTEFANIFVSEPGSGEYRGATYYENIDDFAEPLISKVEKTSKTLTKDEWGEVVRLMQDPDQRFDPNSKVGKAAVDMANVLKEAAGLARDKYGLTIQENAGYFPRDYLVDEIMANPDKFLADAVKAFEQTAIDNGIPGDLSSPEARAEYMKYAEDWLDRIRMREAGVNTSSEFFANMDKDDVPMPPSMKNRPLSKSADDIMRPWLNQDGGEVLVKHLDRLAKKAVFDHTFGGDKFVNMQRQWAKEGVDASDIARSRKIMAVNTGIAWDRPCAEGRMAGSWLALVNMLTFLPRAARNAISENAHIATQNGNLKNLGTDFANMGRAFATKAARGKLDGLFPQSAHAIALLEAMGIVTDFHEANMINSRTELDPKNKYQRLIIKGFHVTGTAPITRASEVAAYFGSDRLIQQLARDIVQHSDTYESAKFMTNGLGIPPEKAHAFSQWVLENPISQLSPEQVTKRGGMEDLYRLAMRRNMGQLIQRPTPAVKALYATNPNASMIYSLTGFFYASEQNVLRRNYRMAKSAITGKTSEGVTMDLTAKDRMRLAYPMALTVTALPLIMGAFNELWDIVYPNSEKKPESLGKKALDAYLGADIAGRFAPIVSAAMYNNPAQITQGPMLSSLSQLTKDLIGVRDNSGNRHVNKRQLTRDAFKSVVIPSMNYAVIASPIPAGVAFGLTQAINQPALRNAFVNKVAGPAKKP